MRNPSNPDSDRQDTGNNPQTPPPTTDASRKAPEPGDADTPQTGDVRNVPIIINRVD